MPYNPADQDELYDELKSRIIERTEKLTNFEEGSLNHTLAYNGFAAYFAYYEHALLAVQLSGWIETAGGPIERDDIIRLGINPERIDLDLLNAYMDDEDLDQLALQNGVTRDPGGRASGEVVFQTAESQVTVPRGTVVQTERDQFSDFQRRYETTSSVTAVEGSTSARATVRAVEVGDDYNVGVGTVTSLASSPGGVRSVRNDEPMSGGEPPETNRELRERAKEAIVQRSGGGTVEGIRGGIVEQVDGVDADNVYIEEFYDPPSGSPYVEVTVQGGEEDTLKNVIDMLHPTGVRHLLRRPTTHIVDTTVELSGAPIDLDAVESEISRYYAELGIGDDVHRAGLIKAIMNADNDIINVETLDIESDRDGLIGGDLTIAPDENAVVGEINVSLA